MTLGHNSYGKAEIHLVHLDRAQEPHRVTDLLVTVELQGDFEATHLEGDNTGLVATDSQKNIVYGLARSEPPGAPESFALRVAGYLVDEYESVDRARVDVEAATWVPLQTDAFRRDGGQLRTATGVATAEGERHVIGGLRGLALLKSANSGFTGFLRDRWTTLPETDDRILASSVRAAWRFSSLEVDFDEQHRARDGCHLRGLCTPPLGVAAADPVPDGGGTAGRLPGGRRGPPLDAQPPSPAGRPVRGRPRQPQCCLPCRRPSLRIDRGRTGAAGRVTRGFGLAGTTAHVSRLNERIARLARISATPPDQGITRESYTELYEEGLRLVEGWMADAGLSTRRDAAGNAFGRLEGSSSDAPCLLVGSHLDTTLNAGPLDGVYGVLAAIEAVDRLRASGGAPGRSVEVVAITAEEPRFATGCLGSRALVGDLSADFARRLTDREGITLAEAMQELSMDPERIPDACLPEGYADLFVELHIEQGAVLEQRGSRLGIVNAIAAPHDLRLTVTGTAAHAGTTPMGLRRDAFLGAAEIALAVEAAALASATGRTVGTVGAVSVRPGANNIVPGHVEIEVDIRDTDLDAREAVVAELLSTAEAVCARRGLELDVKTIAQDTPVTCSETVQKAVAEACAECGIEGHVMASGAYHDAMVLARKMPVGMLFVPSAGGVSHHPDEYTDPADLDLGVDVLAGTLRRLAEPAS